jgi:thioesterase domain-containing protein/acyl carrier protein
MIPPSYIFLKKFPLNLSGKTDRASLLQIKQSLPAVRSQQAGTSVLLRLFRRLRTRLQSNPQHRQSIEAVTALAVETAWRRILPHAPLDKDVSWTDSGGDSLGMLHLLLRLEQALDRKIGFDLLSSEMTQRELIGRLLEENVAAKSDSSLPIVHLVPGILGDDPSLASLRRQFQSRVRFEMVELPGLETGGVILRSLQETVRLVAQEIQERQPTGSIILAGYSFGGMIAFEAAKQILECGRRVALLIVLDAQTQIVPGDRFAERLESEKTFFFRIRGPVLKLAEFDFARRALLALVHLLGSSKRISDFHRLLQTYFRFELGLSWRPATVAVPAVIVLSEAFGPVNRLQWTRLLPNGSLVEIPGTHKEVLASRSLAVYKPILLDFIAGAASNDSTA